MVPVNLDALPIEFEVTEREGSPARISLGAVDGVLSFNQVTRPSAKPRPVPGIPATVSRAVLLTTSAIVVASLWQKRLQQPVLVVDADIEAPGLSYLFADTRSEIAVSFEDLIALAHADPNADKIEVTTWVASRLKSQRLGQLVVLPLRRALDELASSAIRSEHLASLDEPFALADLLSLTAHSAGCGGVVIDLRAGLVPIATQLVLDPNVPRVLCTSLGNQSIKATGALVVQSWHLVDRI